MLAKKDWGENMLRVISVVAFASMVSGCSMSDQAKPYSESAKPGAKQVARATSSTPDAARSLKSTDPNIVLGTAY
jgi:hypothetical protein